MTRHPYPPAASSCASCTLTAHAAQRAAKAHPTPLISPSIRFPWCHSLGYTTTSQSSSVFHQLPLSLLQRLSAARPSLPKTALNSFSVHADRLTTFSVELLNKGRTTRPIFSLDDLPPLSKEELFFRSANLSFARSDVSPEGLRSLDLSRKSITGREFVDLVGSS